MNKNEKKPFHLLIAKQSVQQMIIYHHTTLFVLHFQKGVKHIINNINLRQESKNNQRLSTYI